MLNCTTTHFYGTFSFEMPQNLRLMLLPCFLWAVIFRLIYMQSFILLSFRKVAWSSFGGWGVLHYLCWPSWIRGQKAKNNVRICQGFWSFVVSGSTVRKKNPLKLILKLLLQNIFIIDAWQDPKSILNHSEKADIICQVQKNGNI